jgi:crotonobetainyl-CoA:carnitine CoA-transferase CaiB-like acyl-CoA transferase
VPDGLAGVRVVSFAAHYPGPLCTRLLGDLGAEVVQVERPGTGDPARTANPWLFRSTAVGRSSIALDLKDPDDLAAARRLVERADVLVEGFRPGVMARLGLGYEDVRALNRRLVYCSISSYGQDGPDAAQIGHNINFEAVAGLLDPYVDRHKVDEYFTAGLPLGDILSGLFAALGIVGGLRHAERTGDGRHLDISITDSLLFAMAPHVTRAAAGEPVWSVREAGYAIYPTQDGHVALGIAHEDPFWGELCREPGLADLASLTHAERVTRAAEVRARVEAVLRGRPSKDWVRRLAGRVPCSRVATVAEVAGDAQLRERGLLFEARDEEGRPFTAVRSPLGLPARASVDPLGAGNAWFLEG